MYLFSCTTYIPHSQEGATLKRKEYIKEQNNHQPACSTNSAQRRYASRPERTIESIAATIHAKTSYTQEKHAGVRFQLTMIQRYSSMAGECSRWLCNSVEGLRWLCNSVEGLRWLCNSVEGLRWLCNSVEGLRWLCNSVEVLLQLSGRLALLLQKIEVIAISTPYHIDSKQCPKGFLEGFLAKYYCKHTKKLTSSSKTLRFSFNLQRN